MIADTVLISYDFMTDFNGIDRHFPQPQYPAGVYEPDKTKYSFGPDSTTFPNLTLPCSISDEYGNSISEGYYMAVLSPDMKYINLYQSNKIKARAKVIKLVEQMYTQEELDEETEIIGRLEKAKMKKNLKKIRLAEEELMTFKEKTAADTYAEILDSGKGYFIINYKCNGKIATAIIQK